MWKKRWRTKGRTMKREARRCRIVLFKQFEISPNSWKKLFFPNGECRRGFTTGAKLVRAYKLVINASPLPNKRSFERDATIIAVRRVSFEFENNLHPLLILLYRLSYWHTGYKSPTNDYNDPDQLECKREWAPISFLPKLFPFHPNRGFERVGWLI